MSSLNQPPMDLSPSHRELDRVFEDRLDEALDTAPSVLIPEGFAARVAGLVPPSMPVPKLRQAYSRSSILAGAVVLMLAILVLAPHAVAGATFAITLEWILCAQLSLLALYVALPGSAWRSAR